jgi:hypothetical protein
MIFASWSAYRIRIQYADPHLDADPDPATLKLIPIAET